MPDTAHSSPWRVTADELLCLRGQGGTPFTEFVDALLRAEARCAGVGQDQIATNIKTTVPDGGVDSEVLVPVSPSTSGWMPAPTCWQYKGTSASGLSDSFFESEVGKPRSAQRIGEQFAYRLAVCDDVPPATREELERRLNHALQAVSSSAERGRILLMSDLAEWVAQYPAVVARFFRPWAAAAQTFVAWEASEARGAPYLASTAQQGLRRAIDGYLGMVGAHQAPVFVAVGRPGSGCTRAVLESVRSNADLVLHVPHAEHALSIAVTLSNLDEAHAVLVVDPCSRETLHLLERVLRGHSDRIRCIAVTTSDDIVPKSGFALQPPAATEVTQILSAAPFGFSDQRAYSLATLTLGDLTAAIEIARLNPERLDDASDVLDRLLERHRITEREPLEALSLITRVGYARAVQAELAELCGWLGVDLSTMRRVVQGRDHLGIVARGERYASVRTAAYARILARRAWDRWASSDPESFLGSVPSALEIRFLRRMADHGGEEVRQDISTHYWSRFSSLVLGDLVNEANMARFVLMLEVHPERYLPVLRIALRNAARSDFGAVEPRKLVEALSGLRSRTEWFDVVETCLFLLAQNEAEPGIVNNASGEWAQGFALAFSGSPCPFRVRLARLAERMATAGPLHESLMKEALEVVFSGDFWRFSGPALVAGELPSDDWRPKSWDEFVDCRSAALDLAVSIGRLDSTLGRIARAVVFGQIRTILLEGPPLGDALRTAVTAIAHRPTDDPIVLGELAEFLAYDLDRRDDDAWQQHTAKVREWRDQVAPTNLPERATALLTTTPMSTRLDDREAWTASLTGLAEELLGDRPSLLRWLPTAVVLDRASSAIFDVAEAVGAGAGVELVPEVLRLIPATTARLFLRGYLVGLLGANPDATALVLESLRGHEATSPALVFDLYVTIGSDQRGISEALRMLRDRQVSASCLQEIWRGHPTPAEVEAALHLAVRLDNERAEREQPIGAALELFAAYAHTSFDAALANPGLRAALWEILTIGADDCQGEAHWWAKELEALGRVDPTRGIAVAIQAYLGRDHSARHEAEIFLVTQAAERPREVLQGLEPHLLGDEGGARLFLAGRRKSLVASLPDELVIDWVRTHGVVAARVLAPHLPAPYLTASGTACVPPLTDFVLREHEADETVFSRFRIGVHNLQLYAGDIAAQHEREGEGAQPFFNHDSRRIREWANFEWERARGEARWWREHDEEARGSESE